MRRGTFLKTLIGIAIAPKLLKDLAIPISAPTPKPIIKACDVYVSDFGTLQVTIASRENV